MRLGKGLYTFAPPFRKAEPDPLAVANALKAGSYVSLQTALGRYNLIPEQLVAITSVTTGRPQTLTNFLGRFEYRHLSPGLFWGFQCIEINPGNTAFIAFPEKALLDLFHLTPGSDRAGFIEGLRLQHLEMLDPALIIEFSKRVGQGKLSRASQRLLQAIHREAATTTEVNL